ncbi:MAG TPA: hypothetical protein VFD90_17060 [Gaiellales bacterium]|jgi:hypothetical protein|nr:hypothetical protein [Gaiellales bacterium]
MRRLVLLLICLLALVPAVGSAQAAGGKGSVSKSWISRTSGGTRETSFSSVAVKKLYANFVWKVPAKPGLPLSIEWRDPAGTLRAVWTDKTIKSDKKGTRLYAWIGSGVVKGKPGTWHAVLNVGGTRVGTSLFRVTK